MTFTSLALALLLLTPAGASAQERGMGMGPGHGMGGFGPGRCAKLLMHAHPDVLKAQLGLSDAQIKQIEPLRTALLSKGITVRGQIAQLGLQLKGQFDADLPDQAKVLDLARKIHNLRGQLAEERLKTGLKMLTILSKDQRAKLRARCGGPGMGMGMGKGNGKGWMGRGHGGPGGWGGF